MREILEVVALLVFCVGVPWLAWDLMPRTASADVQPPTASELVTIVLTAVTIVLAVLAIIIAVATAYGYRKIRLEAASAAERAVKEKVEGLVDKHTSDDKLAGLVQRAIEAYMDRNPPAASWTEAAAPVAEDGGQQRTLAADYPKEGGATDEGQAGSGVHPQAPDGRTG